MSMLHASSGVSGGGGGGGSGSFPLVTPNQMAIKDLIFNTENKSKLCLMRTCVSMMPRLMPLFKENELVDILARLTIHLDDELKGI